MFPQKKFLHPGIKQLISSTLGRFRWNCERKSSRTEFYANVIKTEFPLIKIGLHIQLNNFGQWIVYISAIFNRTDMSYEGMAFCEVCVRDSYEKLVKWLSSKTIVNTIYKEIQKLSNSYINSMWTELENSILPEPKYKENPFYEVWYNELVFPDPLCFVERNQSLEIGIHHLMYANKKHKADSKRSKCGEFFTYVLYSQDVMQRKEYILKHDVTLRNSINNFQESIFNSSVKFEVVQHRLSR